MDADSLHTLDKAELIALVLAQAEQIAALLARVTELEARLKVPPKTPSNSSLPPSKGHKSNRPEPNGKRRRKGRPGVARKLTEAPDKTRDIFAERCDGCGTRCSPNDQPNVHAWDHIDLPPIKLIVTRVNLHSGTCSCCGKIVAAMPPPDMPPGSPFGPGIAAFVIDMHSRHMVSYSRLKELLKGLVGLDISEGAIANMLARSAKPFAAEAAAIAEVVRAAPVISSDVGSGCAAPVTSARVKGRTWWQWVMGSATAVSHRIADTRGAKVVTDFLAGAKPEVWVSDRYSAQRGHGVRHQACLAHLLRDTQYAIDAGDWYFAPDFKALLKRAMAIGRRREALTDATLKSYARDLRRQRDRLLDRVPTTEAGQKLREAMIRWKDCLFVFVTRRDVPATNNVSERQLRPSVIFRKVTNGFRSVWGSEVYADTASVIATGALHGRCALDAIKTCLAGRSVLNST